MIEEEIKRKMVDEIKAHIEHWKDVNKYDCPADYIGLKNIIDKWVKKMSNKC